MTADNARAGDPPEVTATTAPEATCYCGRLIRDFGQWKHIDDGSIRCYPDEPRDAEMVAEPDPEANTDCEDICMDECKGPCGAFS